MRSTPRPVGVIETERGTLELALFATDAPLTVHNFVTLAQRHYFDGQRFHRVVPNFVVQGGDPRGDGNGGPGYAIRDEMNRRRYLRGTLGMALSGPNTGGSQFFVTHSPQPHLDGGYTVFGQLIAGGDVLDRIVQGDRIVRVTVR
jgi:cyclophilin family peptidyl-prolyl cis-trans isomerase